MDLKLKEKTVFVTGSSRGLGKAIALRYLEEGARVGLVARNEDLLKKTEKEFQDQFGRERCRAVAADLALPAGVQSCAHFIQREFGSLDILVANAGISRGSSGINISYEEWNDLLQLNLVSPARLMDELFPLLKKSKGSVVLISSIAGREALPAPVAYSTAKLGLTSLTKNYSLLLAKDGIRVNCVCPGNILFPGGVWEKKMKENPEQTKNYIASEVPMQRFASVEEVADAVLFLSSERSSFTTGATLVVDGGQTKGFS